MNKPHIYANSREWVMTYALFTALDVDAFMQGKLRVKPELANH